MLFNSILYFVFLTVSVGVIWIVPKDVRKWMVLGASLVFYGSWKIEFLLLIIFSAFVDYFFSIKIYETKHAFKRKLFLVLSLSINIGLLIYFKYLYFLAENLNSVMKLIGADGSRLDVGRIVLPLGISFYTFLSISYTLDVYRRLFIPVRSFPLYLTYVTFWPHMIAGPILRAVELIPQLSDGKYRPTLERLTNGIQKIAFGIFLKVVLADELAPLVDEAFNADTKTLSGLDVWTMAYAFGFQIYFDFAGYSLIAIGSALLINVKFPENFNWPYLANSPREFWKRWHITLSSWIRDYLYLPLTGKKFHDRSSGGIDVEVGKTSGAKAAAALFLTWFVMGLWHGASWSFALWGVWHATCIFFYRIIARFRLLESRPSLQGVLGWTVTIPVMMLAWIPFRAGTLEKSIDLLARVFNISGYAHLSFRENFYLFVLCLLIGMLLLRFFYHARSKLENKIGILAINSVVYAVVFFLTFIFFKVSDQFIYFQF